MHFIAVLVTLMSIICRSEAGTDHKVAYISVNNGGILGGWGSWRTWQICRNWGLATGFWLKIQPPQGSLVDDTALNGIALRCSTGGYVTSTVGTDGSYVSLRSCLTNRYLKRFRLRVDPYQGTGYDDTAANDIDFICGYKTSGGLYVLSSPSGGILGSFGSWSALCPDNSAICGVRTRIHFTATGDKTGLNDVQFVCCN